MRDFPPELLSLREVSRFLEFVRREVVCGLSHKAMDLGAGQGAFGLPFAREWPGTVTFVEPDVGRANVLCRQIAEEGLSAEVVAGTIEDIATNDFGLITAFFSLHHVTDAVAEVRRCVDRLEPGGVMLICDLEREDGSFHRSTVPHCGFNPSSLSRALKESGLIAEWQPFGVITKGERQYGLFVMAVSIWGCQGRT